MRTKIFCNTQAIENAKNDLMSKVETFNELLKNVINQGFEVKEDNVKTLLENPKQFVIDQLTKGAGCSFGGLKLNTNEAFKILEIPQEVKSIVEAIEDQKPILPNYGVYKISNGQLVLSEKTIQNIEENSSVFITNTSQTEVWKAMQRVEDDLNIISKLSGKKCDKELLFDLLGFNSMEYNPNDNFKANPLFIKNNM